MNKYFIPVLALLFCILAVFTNSAAAKIYIDIDSPTFKLIPIAICDFNDQAANTASPAGSGSTVSEGVKKDLSLTGIFNILNKKSFLEDKESAAARTPEKIRFADWAAIGADYLLKGYAVQNAKETLVECFLFDVTRGELILNKKYRAETGNLQAVSRSMASDIMMALVNDEGDFKTKIAYITRKGVKSDIYVINYDGSELKSVTNHQSIIMSPRWSPDGHFLAFTSYKAGRPEIYIKNLQTGAETKMSYFEGLNLCGAFSPDGKKLLMTLSKDGNEEIYALDTGTFQLQRLTSNYAIDVSPSWSPDGKKIVFVSNRSGSPQIYTMDAGGGNVKRITFEGSYNTSPVWSPRGGRIAYEGRINNKYQIFSIDEDGNNPMQLTFDAATNNESPSWSPSGRQIVYASRKSAGSKIYIINSNGSNPRVLNENSYKLAMPVWSPRLK